MARKQRKYTSAEERSSARQYARAMRGADVIAVVPARRSEHSPGSLAGLLSPQRSVVVSAQGIVVGQRSLVHGRVRVSGSVAVAELAYPVATKRNCVKLATRQGPLWISRREHERLGRAVQPMYEAPDGYQVYQPWVA